MGGPVFNIVFNSLSYSIMYFCFKLRSKYLWSPVPRRSYLQPAALMSCGWAASVVRGFGVTHCRCILFGLYRKYREFLPVGLPAELFGPPVAAMGGVSHSNNSFRSAWPERANLSTCYSSQSVFAATLLYYAESSKGIAFISFTSWFKPCCFL